MGAVSSMARGGCCVCTNSEAKGEGSLGVCRADGEKM